MRAAANLVFIDNLLRNSIFHFTLILTTFPITCLTYNFIEELHFSLSVLSRHAPNGGKCPATSH
jgi:hypothetical protein